MPIKNFHEENQEVALGKYSYSVSFLDSFSDDFPLAQKNGTFELGASDVAIDVEFVFHTLPIQWAITQAGVEKTCADVGASKVTLHYKHRGTTTSTSVACNAESRVVLWPLLSDSYEVSADLLDASDKVLVTWQSADPIVLADTDADGAVVDAAFTM